MDEIDRDVGGRVRQRRLELRFSQDYVASHLGVSFQQVQKYEKGVNRIAPSRLYALAEILSVSPEWFFVEQSIPSGSDKAIPDFAALLETQEFRRLNEAFVRIQHLQLRKRIVALVEAIGR